MFCSTIIPTIGRASLDRAVWSVLDQAFPADEFEVIVVNDTGSPLPHRDWQQDGRVRMLTTNRRNRSFARNAGASIALGQYLHFLDDDDFLLPNALLAFRQVADSDSDWLYGGTQLVDRDEAPQLNMHFSGSGNCLAQAMAGEWLPIQASLIKASRFFEVGGYDPTVVYGQDRDICYRILQDGDLANTQTLVVAITRDDKSSTTNYTEALAYSRAAREAMLARTGVFWRLIASADTGYWYGRVTRIYFFSIAWNLRKKRLFTAISRSSTLLLALLWSGRYLLNPDWWRGVAFSHMSHVSPVATSMG